jgi:hypothetical protein
MEARYNERLKEFQDRIGSGDASAESEMYAYMAKAAPFIAMYTSEAAPEESASKKVANMNIGCKKGVQRQDIFNKYLHYVEDEPVDVRKVDSAFTACPNCKKKFTKIFDSVASEEACGECGYTDFILCEELGFKEEQDMEKNIVYTYKRENHLNEWISQFQAKETTSVPHDLIESLRTEFKKQRVKDLSEITHEKVRGLLKKLGKNKYYEHAPYITTILNGIQPPTMPQSLEDRLRLMFHQVQKPFEKHRPKGRKNFLSYSYILYKFCELLGEDEYLPCFPLLKSKEKLYIQDSMWKLICQELSWQFIKTV